MTIETPVLIVGGGGAGLTASMFLSKLGIRHILVSSLPHTSVLPKAHVLNQRTMEIFQEARSGRPYSGAKHPSGKYEGYGLVCGCCRHARRLWPATCTARGVGGGYTDPDFIAASPFRTANLPQVRLEPLLKQRAEELGGDIRFGHELIECQQDADGVSATVRVRETGENTR